MKPKRIVIQAAVAALLFWGIKLILERSLETEVVLREGKIALVFGLAYAVFLFVRERFFKKGG